MRGREWMLCDTSGVGERSGVLSTGSPFGHHPRLRMVCPLQGQWVRAGRFPFFLSLHFSTSPRVRPLGITRGYAWCVPSGDSGCGLEGFSFFSLSTSLLLHISTGSPFGHHPRLRMVCPLRGQWMDNELFLLLLRKINYGEECFFS